MTLLHLTGPAPFIGDGGIETSLIFQQGIDLPDFAAFPLLDSDAGRRALTDYYEPYLELAERRGVGIVVDTPTWRASLDWGSRLGYDAESLADVNRRAVGFVAGLARASGASVVVNGAIGPRGDGYTITAAMTETEATAYHGLQARALADAGADLVTAITMTYSNEAIGVVRAATATGIPVAISFTTETDGRLPSGELLGRAIERVDELTDGAAAYFNVNCAHPTHFAEAVCSGEAWTDRVKGVRVNASTLSHAELDEAEELDRGDIDGLAAHCSELQRRLDLRVLGGCCGTDVEHVDAIAGALAGQGSDR